MKMIKFFSAGLIALFLMTGVMNSSAGAATKSQTIKMKVNFTCAGCQTKIQNGLGKTEGVEKAVADLDTKVVTITFDPDKTNKEKLVKAIEDIGYTTEFSSKDAKAGHDCSGKKEDCSKKCDGKK
jgi:periplasmic mercuric ion binding protein